MDWIHIRWEQLFVRFYLSHDRILDYQAPSSGNQRFNKKNGSHKYRSIGRDIEICSTWVQSQNSLFIHLKGEILTTKLLGETIENEYNSINNFII
jgi:hypothetical protein